MGLITLCEALVRVIDAILSRLSGRSESASAGFARDVQRRIARTKSGGELLELLSVHRAAMVALLLGGRRSPSSGGDT